MTSLCNKKGKKLDAESMLKPFKSVFFILILIPLLLLSGEHKEATLIEEGKGSFVFKEDSLNYSRPITVWTYLSSKYTSKSAILFVMHGNSRNASTYRDQWIEIAERNKALLLVPEFSTKDFPQDTDYNMGHMFKMDPRDALLSPIPENHWSFSLIEPIYEYVIKHMKNESVGYLIYGHSAGSQFVHRFIFFKPDAKIIKAVCANAGWYTLPDFDIIYPYGLKGTGVDKESLKKVFAKNVTIYLGDADTDTTSSSLRRTPEAMKQGKHRFERGHFFFNACQDIAQKLNLEFSWSLKIAPGIGHSNVKMAIFAEKVLFEDVP